MNFLVFSAAFFILQMLGSFQVTCVNLGSVLIHRSTAAPASTTTTTPVPGSTADLYVLSNVSNLDYIDISVVGGFVPPNLTEMFPGVNGPLGVELDVDLVNPDFGVSNVLIATLNEIFKRIAELRTSSGSK